jgi:MYXO-CTERM domain-containing protein
MLSSLPILLFTLSAIEPGQPIAPTAPWAIAPEGARSHLEAVTGKRIDPRTLPTIRSGTLMYAGDSMSMDMLKSLDLPPLPSLNQDPTPGILYLAMEGLTLKPTCSGPQTANSALNCSPLVDKETTFPSAGSAQTQQAILQKMQKYYADFNLLIANQRPPDWVPYTMAVIGGTSGNAGQPNGVCGIANVACDGAKRNHVSLSFPGSCGAAAETAAQESAHNFGLEHTDVDTDIMYPYLAGAAQFRAECMPISHATGNGTTQCGYVHKVYCPNGGGEQQDSHGELLGVFGPKVTDSTKPTFVSVVPEDGAVFSTADSFVISATITDDSNFVAVKWTWLEGLPPDFQDTGYTRCTNQVCTDDFNAWSKVDQPWDFLAINKPPAGAYKFQIETMDMGGNYATRTISVTVEDAGPDPGTTSATTDASTTSAGEGSGTDGGTDGGTGGESTPTEGGVTGLDTGISGADTDAGTGTGSGSDSASGTAGGGSDDGGCRVAGTPGPASLLLLLALGARRRRRRA